MGMTGEQGKVLSKIFNAIGGILYLIGPIIEIVAKSVAGLIMIIAKLVEWLMDAVKWIAELFGYTDKEFKVTAVADNAAFAKQIEEQKKGLLGASVMPGVDSSKIKGVNTKKAAESSRATQINIKMHNMIGTLEVKAQTINDSVGQIKTMITQTIIEAINDGQRLAGS